MESYVARQQVREVNRKLFANDLIYSNEDRVTLELLISNIIQRYDSEDSIAGVPTILEIKPSNIDKDTLDKILLLSTDSVIIEINNSVLAVPEKVNIIRKIKDRGYKLSVVVNKTDDVFTLAKILADIVKFDIQNIPPAMSEARNAFTCKKLAYNVNTPEDFVIAEAANIDYYEGTYISPSTEVEIDNSEHSNVNFIEIIAMINSDSDVHKIARVISRDSLISAQVIRLANSVYYGTRYRIDSVEDAVVRIGLNNLKRWIFLLQFSKNDNVPEELLQTAYQRAIFCERITKESKIKELTANDAYLIGLFSTLDVLTGKPMDMVLAGMNLNETVEDALIYRDGDGGDLLNLIRAYEEANWKRVDKYISNFKINKDKMFKIYFDSLDEVTQLWKSLTELGGIVK